MPGILIFESDLEFAEGLRGELSRRGCHVDVVSDAAMGLERAQQQPPDLILLCTELPRMNGFSVCNRLKRDPALESVPVIIMSANSSEETFQQHRNLTKKRAQDYVHKPVSVEEMIGRVGQFVNLNGHAAAPPAAAAPALDELDVEDMEEMDELGADSDLSPSEFDNPVPAPPASAYPASQRPISQGPGSQRPVSQRPAPPSERSMNQLTDEVFGALMQGTGFGGPTEAAPAYAAPLTGTEPPPSQRAAHSQLPASSRTPAPPPVSQMPRSQYPGSPATPMPGAVEVAIPAAGTRPPSRPSQVAADARRSSRVPRRSSGGPSAASIPPAGRLPMISEPALDGEFSHEHAQELERTLADTRAKLEAAYQELEAARTKEAGGSARAHEILDLREALNKKEKELLELRDQLTRRDKELLSANDALLEHERKHTEHKDQLSEMEKRAHAGERAHQAAAQDREQANKRADGYKRKLEKTLEDLEHISAEHEELSRERKNLSARAEQAEATLADLTNKLAEATRKSDDLQADLADAEKELANLEVQSEQLQRRLQTNELLQQQTLHALAQSNERVEQQRAIAAQVRELLAQTAQRLNDIG